MPFLDGAPEFFDSGGHTAHAAAEAPVSRFRSPQQTAEILDFRFDFGWRSAGAPITAGFGVMGWSGSPLS